MSELSLIAAIERTLGVRGKRVVRALGDDAAVVRGEAVAVSSLDVVVEGVHFRRDTHSPADVGHKALASALSDLAAMGAEPGEALLGLLLPEGFGEAEALELVEAAEALAARTDVTIVGGDVSSGPALVVTVAVTGWAVSAEELVTRDGARPGELVGVTGELGASEAGRRLLDGLEVELPGVTADALVARHRRPEPLLAAGRALAAAGVTAMIDVSDGIATDARHIAERSGAEIRLELPSLPVARGVAEVAAAAGEDPVAFAASGGEDFELLFCAPPAARSACERAAAEAGSPVTWIGDVREGAGLALLGAGDRPVELRGYEHRAAGAQRRSTERVPPSERGPA